MENQPKSPGSQALRAALIAAGALAMAFGLWKMLHPAGLVERAQPVPNEQERVAEVLKADRVNLAAPHARDSDIYGALVRLAQRSDEYARQEAVKRSKDASTLIREGAASALGYFGDDEALAVLTRLVKDPELAVRVQSLQALGFKPGEGREKLLHEALRTPGISSEERTAGWSSLARIAKDPAARPGFVAELVKIARHDKNEGISTNAAMTALSLAPRDPGVLELLRELLTEGRNLRVLPTAFRHLAISRDPWLVRNFGKFVDHKDARIRLAVIQSVHLVCPAERWTILEAAITGERDRQVLAQAIQEPRFMPGPEAVAFVERMLANPAGEKLQPEELARQKDVLAELKRNPASDPCYNFLKK